MNESSQLLKLLASLKLDELYYSFYESHKHHEDAKERNITHSQLRQVFAELEFPVVFDKTEKFYLHRESDENTIELCTALLHGSYIEFVLSVDVAEDHIGGPVPMLARRVAQLRDPNFEYSPRSPKLPASNLESLRETLAFGISLFKSIKATLQSTTRPEPFKS